MAEKEDIKGLIDVVRTLTADLPSSGFSGFNEKALQMIFYCSVRIGTNKALRPSFEFETGDPGRGTCSLRTSVQAK